MHHFFIGLAGSAAMIGGTFIIVLAQNFPDYAAKLEMAGTIFVIAGLILVGTQVAPIFQ